MAGLGVKTFSHSTKRLEQGDLITNLVYLGLPFSILHIVALGKPKEVVKTEEIII